MLGCEMRKRTLFLHGHLIFFLSVLIVVVVRNIRHNRIIWRFYHSSQFVFGIRFFSRFLFCMPRYPRGGNVIEASGTAMPYPIFYLPFNAAAAFITEIPAPEIPFKNGLDFLPISFKVLQWMFATAFKLKWKWPAYCTNVISTFIAVPNAAWCI